MAEQIKARLRVKEMFLGEPLTDKATIASHAWGDPLPVTFRDDELIVTEEDPEEDAVYSHENDTPEEVDYSGKGLKLNGSFIRATREQLVTLMGGTIEAGKYAHSASKLKLNKAFKIICHDDSEVIIPNADGYVSMNLSLGKSAVSKFPFKFSLKKASANWDCDILF